MANRLFDVEYDESEDALYIYLAPNVAPGSAVRNVIAEVVPERGEVILDFDSAGKLLGIEVLGASEFVSPAVIEAAKRIDNKDES